MNSRRLTGMNIRMIALFVIISAAMAWCQVLAQGSGPNLDEMYRRLAALEQQNLGRTYTDDDIAGRFERLELKLLGHLQSGSYQRRLDELLLLSGPGTSVSPAGSAPSLPIPNTPYQQQPVNQADSTGNNQDYWPYLSDLNRRIKRAWFPPQGSNEGRCSLLFDIDGGGALSNLRVFSSSGVTLADQSALKAVENASPFRPLPAGTIKLSVNALFNRAGKVANVTCAVERAPGGGLPYAGYNNMPPVQKLDGQTMIAVQQRLASIYNCPHEGPRTARVLFTIKPDGTVGENSISVYNSSGNPTVDEAIKSAIRAGVPYPAAGIAAPLSAVVNLGSRIISVQSPPPVVDFGPFMMLLQRTIKSGWYPPTGKESLRATVVFKIQADGRMSNLRFTQATGDRQADEACVKAVESAKVEPLPEGSPDSVDVSFTFDYNVHHNK